MHHNSNGRRKLLNTNLPPNGRTTTYPCDEWLCRIRSSYKCFVDHVLCAWSAQILTNKLVKGARMPCNHHFQCEINTFVHSNRLSAPSQCFSKHVANIRNSANSRHLQLLKANLDTFELQFTRVYRSFGRLINIPMPYFHGFNFTNVPCPDKFN